MDAKVKRFTAYRLNTGKRIVLLRFPTSACHKRDVEKLMERLVSEDSVFPDQLPYIIDDYLIELYS
jgi:hypothetical protein